MKTPFRWVACAIVLMLTAFLPAHAAGTLGKDTVGAQPSGPLTPNYKRVSKFVLGESAIVETMLVYLDSVGGSDADPATQPVSVLIYADDNGVPGAKLFQSPSQLIPTITNPGWRYFEVPMIPLAAGTYWLGIHSGGTVAVARDYGDPTNTTSWYGNADSFDDGASGVFGAGSPGTASLSIFAIYLPPDQLSIAGRTSIATKPSGGLSSNFKRGSRFTMPERGAPFFLSAYLDSLGGGTSAQTVRLALYRDAGGVPGERVATTEEITLFPGSQPEWRTTRVNYPQPELDPGDYWLIIHSGATAGVIRNYGDGAPNWYGNADPYSDGPSSPFGTGNTGAVTITAVAIYEPSNVPSIKFGRTTVATRPSNGLTANYVRGSAYGALSYWNEGTPTAFWAYLDGLGGASGTQQLRMALYFDNLYHGEPATKVVESDLVTIAAGTPPGWVRFPISTPAHFSQAQLYWIVLQSGSTGGVVRDYGDGPANWYGEQAPFSTAAPGEFPHYERATSGTVEPSMYMEYAVHR